MRRLIVPLTYAFFLMFGIQVGLGARHFGADPLYGRYGIIAVVILWALIELILVPGYLNPTYASGPEDERKLIVLTDLIRAVMLSVLACSATIAFWR